MNDFLYWTGAIVWAILACAVLWLILHILGNIYGGFTGYRRYRRLLSDARPELPKVTIAQSVAAGLSCWAGGNRYENGLGKYWEVGCQKVPVDGRSPLPPETYYG